MARRRRARRPRSLRSTRPSSAAAARRAARSNASSSSGAATADSCPISRRIVTSVREAINGSATPSIQTRVRRPSPRSSPVIRSRAKMRSARANLPKPNATMRESDATQPSCHCPPTSGPAYKAGWWPSCVTPPRLDVLDIRTCHHSVGDGSVCCRRASDACARRRPRVEPGIRDRLSTPFTDTVCAALQPLDCRLDLGQVTPDLDHERCNLRPLERDRRTFRIVLVIGVAVTGGRHHLIEVGGQGREALERLLSFRLKQLASPVHPTMLSPLGAMQATGLLGIRTCCGHRSPGDTSHALRYRKS